MPKPAFKPAEYVKRALFVMLLLAVGFGAERVWQSYRRNSELRVATAAGAGRDRAVLIGGSIAIGLGRKIEHYLREINHRENIDVIERSYPLTTSKDALRLTKEALSELHPKVILYMLGLHESFGQKSEWADAARALLKKGDAPALAEHLARGLDGTETFPILIFTIDEIKTLRQEKYQSAIKPVIESRFNAVLPYLGKDKGKQGRAIGLSMLGIWTLAPGPNWVRETEFRDSREIATNIRTLVGNLLVRFRKWPGELSRLGPARFIQTGPPDEEFLRAWFLTAWSARNPQTDKNALDYFTKHPDYVLKAFPWIEHYKADLKAAEILTHDEPAGFFKALRTVKTIPLPEEDVMAFMKSAQQPGWTNEKLFRQTAPELVRLARSGGADPFFLQYPNRTLPAVQAAGGELDVPVIGDETLFKDGIQEKGRDYYFLDEIGTTGHLTEVGLEIYGKFIAEQLMKNLND